MSDEVDRSMAYPPMDVTIKNWPDKWAKPMQVKKTTFATYVLDPTVKANAFAEICGYEPDRYRLVIEPIDAPIVAYLEQPKTVPELALVSGTFAAYSGGRYLPTLEADSQGQTVSNPAVGTDDVITVPTGETWRLDNILTRLVTSAVVGNRQMTLVIDDGTNNNVIWTLQAAVNQAASLTQDYIFSVGVQEIALRGGIQQEPLPPLMLKGGYRIKTVTTGIGVADQWGPDIVNYTKVGAVGLSGIGLYEFFGPDAMWINSITGAPTRVGVTKEYC